MEYLFSHKKEEIIPFTTTWMECEVIMLNEISHIEKDKYCVISCVESKKQERERKPLIEKEI